jgi:small nuclear ribonucleoprotein (snRNP)-like protein
MDKKICVKFTGGREVTGTLKGYDALMNLVLDDVDEVVRGMFCSARGERGKGEERRVVWIVG